MNDRERIAELEAKVERLERDLAQSQALRRQAVAARDVQVAKQQRTREQLEVLRGRRAVRTALQLSATARRILDPMRRLLAGPRRAIRSIRRRGGMAASTRRSGQATVAAEQALAAAIRHDLTPASVDRGPLVSVVILNRDGRDHLERCLRAVATTAYQDVEIIVVDNGSTDGSAELAEGFELPFPIRVLRNTENRSFSDANDQAAAVATGELLCFLNNDVEPITEDWLGYMVETLTTTDAVAVGARLIYPSTRGVTRAGARFADLTLQHRGVEFDRGEAVPLPRVLGAGEDPRAAAAVAIEEVPALTAACLLVSRAAFDAWAGSRRNTTTASRMSTWVSGSAPLAVASSMTAVRPCGTTSPRRAPPIRTHATVARRPQPRGVPRRLGCGCLPGGVARCPRGRRSVSPSVPSTSRSSAPVGPTRGRSNWPWQPRGSWLAGQPVIPGPDGAVALDPSVEAVIVVDDAIDLWQLPSRLVSIAWIGGDPERWLGRQGFDDYDIVLVADPEAAATIRTRSAKTASVVPPGASGTAVRDARRRVGRGHPLRPARRGPESGRRGALGRLSLRPGPPTLAGASRPPDTCPLPPRLGLGGRGARRRRGPPLRAEGGADPQGPGQRPVADQPPGSGHPGAVRALRPGLRGVGPVRGTDGRTGRRPGQPAPPGDRSRALPARAGRAAPRAAVRGQLTQGPPADRRRPRRHRARPCDLRRQLDARAGRPALRQGRGRPECRARALLQRRRRSCSTTTGTTCSPRASSRTGCTTRSPAGRSSSPTTSTASRPSSTTRSSPTPIGPSSARSSTAIWPTRTSAGGGVSAAGRRSSPGTPSTNARRVLRGSVDRLLPVVRAR